MATETRIICARVADVHGPPVSSSQVPCSQCASGVWLDLELKPLAAVVGVVCVRCTVRNDRRTR